MDFRIQLSICQFCSSGKYVRWYCDSCATGESPRCDDCSLSSVTCCYCYCRDPQNSHLQLTCSVVSCTALPFRVCTNCRSIAGASYFHTCYTHWEAAGRPCLLESCNATADEDLQQFFFRCKKCLREHDPLQQWRKLGQASLFAQRSLYSCGASIIGNEPALQLLTVPSCA